ncbi:hypothetical protein [Microbacterium sp.]|uniref:hypothetical protein n=1 Tax=Microbacterium sp. TaxID=51671 RepID=UPI00262106C7|nr:hypothetical protein [Microbacterium sp.]
MRPRQRMNTAAPLFTAAAVSYAANCALGAAVATKVVDTSGVRWLHHALYIATCASTAAAVTTAWWGRARPTNRHAACALMPAAVPLALIPYGGTRGRRHPLIALAAAPFFAASLVRSRRRVPEGK